MPYPEEFQFDVVLRDGGVARIRPIRPSDADEIRALFDRTGAETRYFRFFRAKSELTDEEVEHLVNVDYHDRMALVALVDGRIVGVGRYDRDPDRPDVAEVAFLVEDAHQGRGIGTILLQLLTSYARRHGIRAFRAFVLPENVQMMRVFRNSGFQMRRDLEQGVYIVELPTEYTESARKAEEEREKQAVASSLLPIFYPRSIAVVGASRDRRSIGGRLFRNLLKEDFNGPVYPVNPKADVVAAVRAYPSLLDIPDPVDLAFIVVPAPYVLDVVRQADEKNVRGLVVISAGFSEVGGEGAERERELLELVRTAGMRMVGPNCMGVLNTDPAVRLNGTFAPVYPPHGNVAMASQSGALGIAILDYALRNDLGISTFVSMGNKADISGNDLLLYWEDDPATDVIVLYLESFGNPRRFGRLARRIGRKKPILAVKSGRTAAGTRAASSHTGALASADTAVEALFRQAGVIRTLTLEELFDVTAMLADQPVPEGDRVAVVTNAGGPGILAADALESNGLSLPEFSEVLQARLREVLPPEAATRNPVDLIASAGPAEYAHCLDVLFTTDEVDAVMAIYIPTTEEGMTEVASAIREVARRHHGKKPFLSVFMSTDGAAGLLSDEEVRIPTYLFPEAAALALARAVDYGRWRSRPEGTIPRFDDVDPARARAIVESALARIGDEGGWLEPEEVDALLGAFGIALPRSVVAANEDQAVAAFREIGGPVVLKVLSPSALHKSDVGGVALDLRTEEEVREAYRRVTAAVPDPEGVLVQEMIPGGHEVLIGMAEDPLFGPLIAFGLGGVFVELLEDVAFRLHPLTDLDAAEMVREIKAAPLLDGYRSFPPGDVPALQETLLRVSALVEVVPELKEMDLNPVKVLPPGQGVRAVDARMRVAPVPQAWLPEYRDIPSVATRIAPGGHR